MRGVFIFQMTGLVLEDNKTLADSGFTSQVAKAQCPGVLGLAIRDGGKMKLVLGRNSVLYIVKILF